LPIQTPVSPDGKYVVTANTLSGTIAIIDTKTNEIVASLPCDPGCHGVNFGAKEGGGYYAYVSSKFSNRMIVVDADPNKNGNLAEAEIAGSILLTGDYDLIDKPFFATDDEITDYHGMGGQGVYAIPNVYSGWVQQLDLTWDLTPEQRNPLDAIDNYQQQLEQQQLEQIKEQLEQQQLEQQQLEQQQLEQQQLEQQQLEQQQLEQQQLEQQQLEQEELEQLHQYQYQQQLESVHPAQSNNNDVNMDTLQTRQQQETTTPESFADKIAKIRQQSANQAIDPKLKEENVNTSLEDLGNIISMLPIPYP
jgi:YVTN family beta-propeller protein